MNPLAMMWADREASRIRRAKEVAELRALAKDLHESQAAIAPLVAEANARRASLMRQDGPSGFVMVGGKK